MKTKNSKKGISLITLVITIIVVIILAAAVILTLNNNNPIETAKEATFKSDVTTIQDDLNLYVTNKYAKAEGAYDITTLNLTDTTSPTIANELKSVESSKLKGKVEVQNGKLVFTGTDETEQKWFESVLTGNGAATPLPPVEPPTPPKPVGEGTTNKAESAWNKPYVPSDFYYVTGRVATGYVIADNDGNEFVWIPVDGANVKYEKWCTSGLSHAQTSDVENTEYPIGITRETEKSIVEKVGGFYIGRYEAGVPADQTAIDGESAPTSNKAGIPVSKKGAKIWTSIDYTNANANARAYKNNTEVASGLMSGTSWDTVCKWLQNSGYNVTNSRTWGNHNTSIAPANVTGFGYKQTAGYSDKWRANKIYDLAGNTYELTNELYSSNFVYRSGYCYNDGRNLPASGRHGGRSGDFTNSTYGFRVALYIK